MSNLSETAKISCHYEPFTTAGAIFWKTDRKLICTPNKIWKNKWLTYKSSHNTKLIK